MENNLRIIEESQSDTKNMGYFENAYIFVVIFSILSVVINMIFIINYILKKCINKKTKKISSLEQILFVLSFLDCIISLLWFISGIKYSKTESMKSDNDNEICLGCQIIGILQTFFYIFNWILSSLAMFHLKNMILNPIKFILKPFKKILIYLLISGGIAIIVTITCFFFKLIGISPMISCFITFDINEELKIPKKIILSLIILIPLINIFFFILHSFIICRNPSYKTDSENKRLFKDHSLYNFINHVINILMVTLFIIDLFKKKLNDLGKWYFYFVTLIICFNPLFVGIIRLTQTGILQLIIKKLCSTCIKKTEVQGPLLSTDDKELNIENYEMSAVKKFVMNIYISVCYCLEKSYTQQTNDCKIEQDICNETNEYTISKSEINKDLHLTKLPQDILVKSREDFNISCVEYAPQIFSYLRKLDLVKEEDIINSLLPMNNKNGIQDSEGRGGSFFLNTDDNEFSLKTITFDEAELIRGLLLCRLAQYLSDNNNSIIGRIYGVYKISMKTGLFKEDEIYFILMKNVIGSFAENLICKYDLKGSSLNRKVNLGEFVTNVMKDNNFKDIEQVLLLNNKNAKKLLEIATEDANFFCGVKVMDYSLLVAKISLNNDEIEDLFGKFHRRESEIEYFKMAGIPDKIPENKDSTVKIENNDDENEKLINENLEKRENEKIKKIRYKKDKIKPLKKYFFPSLKGDILYIIAIIDFFQLYNLQKTLETQLKLLKSGVTKNDISSMPPDGYKNRFIEFVKNITNSEKYLKEINDPENKDDFNI